MLNLIQQVKKVQLSDAYDLFIDLIQLYNQSTSHIEFFEDSSILDFTEDSVYSFMNLWRMYHPAVYAKNKSLILKELNQ
jgi:hypothetical protein